MEKETVDIGTPTERKCPHKEGMKASECMACELEQKDRIAKRLAEVMREEGMADPAEQFAIMVGLGIAGFACGGTSRDAVMKGVNEAFDKALAAIKP